MLSLLKREQIRENAMALKKLNNIQLWVETFGNPKHIPFLLILGAGAVSTLFPDFFCESLSQKGFYVIRYDQRDYGLSTHFPAIDASLLGNKSKIRECIPYTMEDLENDAWSVLQSLTTQKAIVLGYSMGGHIAQMMAAHHPDRLLAAISMSAGPTSTSIQLEPFPQNVLDRLMRNVPIGEFEKDLSGWMDSFHFLNGEKYLADENMIISYVKDIYQREKKPSIAVNHIAVQILIPDLSYTLRSNCIPFLVLHGENDPLQPISYGKATASMISNSVFHPIHGAGHMFFNKEIWNEIEKIILVWIKNIKY